MRLEIGTILRIIVRKLSQNDILDFQSLGFDISHQLPKLGLLGVKNPTKRVISSKCVPNCRTWHPVCKTVRKQSFLAFTGFQKNLASDFSGIE